MLRVGWILLFIRLKRRVLNVSVWLFGYRRRRSIVPQEGIIWPGDIINARRVNELGKSGVAVSKGDVESAIEILGVSKKYWGKGRRVRIYRRKIGSLLADDDHSCGAFDIGHFAALIIGYPERLIGAFRNRIVRIRIPQGIIGPTNCVLFAGTSCDLHIVGRQKLVEMRA